MYLYPYRKGSKSANDLSHAMGIKQIKLNNSKFRGSPDKTIINWGRSSISEEAAKCRIVNSPAAVASASNKLDFFSTVKEAGKTYIPNFATDFDGAKLMIEQGHKVVSRQILNGHSGAGIVVCETIEQLKKAPAELYVQYIPKQAEYRVHIMAGEVIDVQRKARNRDVPDEDVNWLVRNHKNGFIYAREGGEVDIPGVAKRMAISATVVTGLQFGAVDMIYNKKNDAWYVLEVNTAPGLTGQTLIKYAASLQEYYGQ